MLDGILCVMYISKKKYNSYFIWLWSQVQKWYTLLGKKLDFAYQKNEKWQQKPHKKHTVMEHGTPSNI